ncbi:MAG: FMN-binding protein [Oscillospiraceae bacterium]|jgi:electron transport complex protein RnfG|nr:FMN-binding protein [Oscillospiraceae bacterium]
MKKDFIAPIVVLLLICIVTTGVLAATNSVTAPVIAAAAKERADAERIAILPSADGFELIDMELPEGVTEAYAATNGVGYVFIVTASGYGGADSLIIMAAVSEEGSIIGVTTLANNETQGLGSRVSEPEYQGQFVGMDSALDGYEAVTGATISSEAYRGAVTGALRAFELIKENGGAAK